MIYINKKHEYIINNTYGLLKLLEIYRDEYNRLVGKTECIKCGKIKIVRLTDLYNLKCISCSCQNIKHNMYKTKLYSVYSNMKYRCYNPKCHAYKNYGGKGIKICEEWLNSFEKFYQWSVDNGYTEGLTIDRIDSNDDYKPSNCRWITLSENVAYSNTNIRRKSNNGKYYGISPQNEYFEFDNASQFAREHNLNDGMVRQVANGKSKQYNGWKFGFIKNL